MKRFVMYGTTAENLSKAQIARMTNREKRTHAKTTAIIELVEENGVTAVYANLSDCSVNDQFVKKIGLAKAKENPRLSVLSDITKSGYPADETISAICFALLSHDRKYRKEVLNDIENDTKKFMEDILVYSGAEMSF